MTLIYDLGSYHGEQTGRQKKKLRNYVPIFQVSMDAEMAGEMEELGAELEEGPSPQLGADSGAGCPALAGRAAGDRFPS